MPKQNRNSTRHSGVFFVELDSGDQTFFIRYKKDRKLIEERARRKARDGRQQKPIVSELSDWPENLNLMSRNGPERRYEMSPWKTGGHSRKSLMNILPVALT